MSEIYRERLLVAVLNLSAEIRALQQFVVATPWRHEDWLDAAERLMALENRQESLMHELRELTEGGS